MLQTPAPPSPARRPTSANLLKSLRKLHLYVGLFIAPALLFFAFTGAVQTLSLHEGAGDSYAPPKWLAELSQVHKNQTLQMHKAASAPAADVAQRHPAESPNRRPPRRPGLRSRFRPSRSSTSR